MWGPDKFSKADHPLAIMVRLLCCKRHYKTENTIVLKFVVGWSEISKPFDSSSREKFNTQKMESSWVVVLSTSRLLSCVLGLSDDICIVGAKPTI